ncbi:MAG: ATP-dependent RecD-like DNA helicase [Bacillota bacterium]|nr:ATP-dependent RecD-like DNA helicase [Bacillota bacterium]
MEIKAKLEYIIFENKQNHYVVGSFSQLDTYHIFTGAGMMVDPMEDQDYTLTGEYVKHPRFGEQFQILSAIKILPTQEKAIIHFLSSDAFPGIGKQTAQNIFDTLGDTCLEQILEDSSCLYQVKNLPQKKIDVIEEGMKEFQSFNETYIQLMKYGLSPQKIALLEKTYQNPLDIIESNCFQPLYEVYGFGYKSACKIADMQQMAPNDERRLDAYLYEVTRQLCMSTGNTYISFPNILERCKNIDINLVKESLNRLSNQESIYMEETRIYPFNLFDDEKIIAQEIFHHIFPVDDIDSDILDSKIRGIEFANSIEYGKEQKKAIHAFFNNSCMILNGGPGTGKTTTVRGILQICRDIYPDCRIQLCAPTGRASKRLAQLSDDDSKTIHSLLKWNLDDNSFGVDENEPLDCEFLIVDEFSMVDTHLFAHLLLGLPKYCRILLIGDEDQLESVGPGKVFIDLIQSEIFPHIHLNTIFRQSNGSGIVSLAQQIREEKTCIYEDGVHFIETSTQQSLDEIISLAMRYSDKDLQILAPMYKGAAGIDIINNTLQNIYNPSIKGRKDLKVGTTTFRLHDKVMLLKNMPDNDVYNGDIGTIVDLEIKGKEYLVSVNFGSNIVDFNTDILYYLTHAYCISVHKSQGSEYDNVIVVIDPQARGMMNKRLLYTAISRAKKELYIIGNRQVFESSIRLKQTHVRQTSLQECIQKRKEKNLEVDFELF